MQVMPIRRVWMGAAAAVSALAVWFVLWPYAEGLSLVIRAAGLRGPARRLADLAARATVDRPFDLTTRRGALRARLYRPAGRGTGPVRVRRTVLLVSGLHPAGIDEPRLVSIARDLAASGLGVVTPEIPDLSRFVITPAITDAIEDAALRLSNAPFSDLRPGDPRIGLMGISFSGGLSIVAAGRESLRGRIAYVFAFGGHDDLPRVLRYLCTGIEPPPPGGVHFDNGDAAAPRLPHDYGVAVLLLGVADRLVPAAQVESLRAAVGRFLWASHLDRVDKKKAVEEFTALRDLARRLPPPESTLLNYVNARDVVHLGARLLPYIGAYGNAPALSPSKSAKPSAPVYLLHGIDDNVIPAVESVYLTEHLQEHAPVRLLLSRLISHAEADQPARLPDILSLADFWGDLLGR